MRRKSSVRKSGGGQSGEKGRLEKRRRKGKGERKAMSIKCQHRKGGDSFHTNAAKQSCETSQVLPLLKKVGLPQRENPDNDGSKRQ